MEAIAVAMVAAVSPFFLYRFDARRADKQDAEMEEIASQLGMKEEALHIRMRRHRRISKYAGNDVNQNSFRLPLIYASLLTFGGTFLIAYHFQQKILEDSEVALQLGFSLMGFALVIVITIGIFVNLSSRKLKKEQESILEELGRLYAQAEKEAGEQPGSEKFN